MPACVTQFSKGQGNNRKLRDLSFYQCTVNNKLTDRRAQSMPNTRKSNKIRCGGQRAVGWEWVDCYITPVVGCPAEKVLEKVWEQGMQISGQRTF